MTVDTLDKRKSHRPFVHLDLAATPIFRLWFGVAQHLFSDLDRLEAAIKAGANSTLHRGDDAEFVIAARGWSECVNFGNFHWYKTRFETTSKFFQDRFAESKVQAQAMIKAILADSP